ncbi:MAG: GNAT family protein [Ferruginibacter sp.]
MIRLEYFTPDDFEQLINWVNTEALLTNWAGSLFSFPLTKESMEWYLQDTNDLEISDAFAYKVVEVETNTVIGHISLGGVSRKNRSARISRVLIGSDQHKGKGYCTEMMKAVLKIGFEELNLHRISLGVYHTNLSALKCYQSAGFSIEGTMRDVLLHKDEWWSLVEMGILEDEWRRISS